MQRLLVNHIIPFSNVDGEGNRLSIFVQGCNINCIYCHNSETINVCNNCGKCVDVCEAEALTLVNGQVIYDVNKCVECDSCIMICPNQSSPKATWYTLPELLEMIEKYKSFIRGITVSGGEATLYDDVLKDLFASVQAMGLTTFIDTNGFFDYEKLKPLIDVTDKFLFDVKAFDNLQIICGINSKEHINNLKLLVERDKVGEIRTVIVSELVDCKNTIRQVAEIIKNYNVPYYLILPHTKGLKSHQKKKLQGYLPSKEYLQELKLFAESIGIKKVIISG